MGVPFTLATRTALVLVQRWGSGWFTAADLSPELGSDGASNALDVFIRMRLAERRRVKGSKVSGRNRPLWEYRLTGPGRAVAETLASKPRPRKAKSLPASKQGLP